MRRKGHPEAAGQHEKGSLAKIARLRVRLDSASNRGGRSRIGIGDSVYAKGSREFLAKLLFRMQDAEADPVGAARKLLARGRSYGLNRRITRADRARSAPS